MDIIAPIKVHVLLGKMPHAYHNFLKGEFRDHMQLFSLCVHGIKVRPRLNLRKVTMTNYLTKELLTQQNSEWWVAISLHKTLHNTVTILFNVHYPVLFHTIIYGNIMYQS